MNKQQIDKLLKMFFATSAILVIIGSIFKIQHYPYGKLILTIGLCLSFLSLGAKAIYHKNRQQTR